MRPIDADELLKKINDVYSGYMLSEQFAPTDFARMVEEAPAVEPSPAKKWIPVTERLPENAKHKGAFCPKYYVMTEYGVTEGWFNPDVECWYVLLWFMVGRLEERDINIDKGDIPKLVKNVPVIAWMPLPKPYKGGE